MDQLIDSAAAILPELRERFAEFDEARRLPGDLTRRLSGLGFFRMMLGRELGGLEADSATAARVVEDLSTASPSVGWVVMIIASTNFWSARVLPEDALSEVFAPGAPVNVAGTLVPHGRAVKADGGWRLSGRWPFGSGCRQAHWMASGSWLHDGQGPVLEDDGAPAWRLFHIPIADCEILDTWYSTGLRGTGSHDYTMDDVFVPDRLVTRHSLLAPSLRPGRYYAYPAVVIPMMSAVSLGAARGAVDGLIELFGGKLDRRSGRPVADSFDKQADLGAAEALVGSARAYLYEALREVWDRVMAGGEPSTDLRARLRLACTNAVTASVQAVDRVYGAAGASSIYVSSPVERLFRDVHTAAAHAFMRPSTMADGGALLLGQELGFRTF